MTYMYNAKLINKSKCPLLLKQQLYTDDTNFNLELFTFELYL